MAKISILIRHKRGLPLCVICVWIRRLSSISAQSSLFQQTNERENGQFVSIHIDQTYRHLQYIVKGHKSLLSFHRPNRHYYRISVHNLPCMLTGPYFSGVSIVKAPFGVLMLSSFTVMSAYEPSGLPGRFLCHEATRNISSPLWMGCRSIAGLPRELNSPVPIYHLGGERHCESKLSRPKKTIQCHRPGLEPEPLHPESSVLN